MNDTSKYTIKLTYDQVDHIISSEIEDAIVQLKKDLKSRKKDNHSLAVFDHDKDEDIKKIKEMIDCLEKVKHYFGG